MKKFCLKFKKVPYSPWIDVGCFEASGVYYLMQMKFNLNTNKKRFKRIRMGWVNDYSSKNEIYTKVKKYNTDRASLIIKQKNENN